MILRRANSHNTLKLGMQLIGKHVRIGSVGSSYLATDSPYTALMLSTWVEFGGVRTSARVSPYCSKHNIT